MYIIEAANVFTGSLHVDAQSGLPLTTKTEEGHGFGLSGIRHVAPLMKNLFNLYFGPSFVTLKRNVVK